MPSSLRRISRLLLGLFLTGIGAAMGHAAAGQAATGQAATGHAATGRAAGGHPGGLTAAPGMHLPTLPQQPIAVNAASVEVDYKNQTVVYQKVVISQGNILVRADHARTTVGQAQRRSEWTLQGNVRIQAPPHGSLNSDTAMVDVQDNRIVRATVTGKPAQFTQQSATGKLAQGHADQIVYDVSRGTVQLSDDAWLSDGRNQISGPLVTYDVLKDQIEASSPGTGERVHLTITPQTPGARKGVPKTKPPVTHGPGPAKPPHGSTT